MISKESVVGFLCMIRSIRPRLDMEVLTIKDCSLIW